MTIMYEKIAERAFEIWKEEGEIEGQEQAHWIRAEAELRQHGMKEQKGKKVTSKDPAMFKTPRCENL